MQSPDSSEANKATLAIGSGSKVMVWELSNNNNSNENQPRIFNPYPEYDDGVPVSSLAWNHNQMVIATSSGISTQDLKHDNIVLLSSQSGQVLDSFRHDSDWKQKQQVGSASKSVSFGGKSRYLCIGDESGAVCLWDLKKKIRVRQFFHHQAKSGSSSPSQQVSLDPKDTYVLSLSPSELYQYNLRDGQLVGTLSLPQPTADIDVAHFTIFSISDLEPNLIAIGTDDGSVYVHDISNPSLQAVAKFEMAQKHSGEVTGLAFSPVNPNILFSCGTDGTILIHNKADKMSRKLRRDQGKPSEILSMGLHANGTHCAVGCQSGEVLVYDLHSANGANEEPTLLVSFRASEPVHSLSFAPPPRAKQRQSGKSKVSNTEKASVEEKATVEASSSNSAPAPTQTKATTSPPKESNETKVIPPKAQQQSPVSPKNKTSPAKNNNNKPRAASPFARKLASLTSINKAAKQQKAAASAASTKATTTASHRAPLSPRRFNSSPKNNKFNARIQAKESPPKPKPPQDAEQIREVVREEVENLQDEMEEQLRNLHIDMINQFHQQSQEIENVMSKHFEALERLTAENLQLREENERLRQGLPG